VWVDRYDSLKRALLHAWAILPLSRRVRSAIYWWVGGKFAVGVQGLIFDDEGRLLLLRHTYKGRYPWGLPGGGMGAAETPASAIIRETREEAGLHVTVERLLAVERHPRRLLIELFFLCRSTGGVFRPNAEIAGCAYFALADLPPDIEPRLRRLLGRLAPAARALETASRH
jgi:8-oxo-dGTP diphosphatase